MSADEVDNMDYQEAILYSNYLHKTDEYKVKQLAAELAKAVWGGKK